MGYTFAGSFGSAPNPCLAQSRRGPNPRLLAGWRDAATAEGVGVSSATASWSLLSYTAADRCLLLHTRRKSLLGSAAHERNFGFLQFPGHPALAMVEVGLWRNWLLRILRVRWLQALLSLAGASVPSPSSDSLLGH